MLIKEYKILGLFLLADIFFKVVSRLADLFSWFFLQIDSILNERLSEWQIIQFVLGLGWGLDVFVEEFWVGRRKKILYINLGGGVVKIGLKKFFDEGVIRLVLENIIFLININIYILINEWPYDRGKTVHACTNALLN